MLLINNIIWFLINDIEMFRKYLKIDKWMFFGGLWGIILVLCYVINYFDRVLYIVLWGFFLGIKYDFIWFY